MMVEYYISYAYKIIVTKLPFDKYDKQIIYSRLMEHRDITYSKWIYLYILKIIATLKIIIRANGM